jgi:hypothetical protein
MKSMKIRKSPLFLLLLILAIGLTTYGTARAAMEVIGGTSGGRPLHAALSGGQEVPGPGDPDGSGLAVITLNQGQGTVCWDLSVTGIAPATAAHIHEGAKGVAGPVVVTLTPPDDGSSSGCATVDADLIMEIRQSPWLYYVNVHNADYPSGALRGQLGKQHVEPYPYPYP